ncbi:uncharacterized protein LY89DRAFT_735476 [Mollisia scopiformis]|uniref:Uncharacterized protein n=1 Tax=Mollisia scopiformis TaxID=149040 RepID=A0A194X5J7_MOLSC|nr:uncharacterized protein LY89DRAFT_735476 [Mollisia scopiformis]KUJ15354.1 hypothetical protein LY89DRAFT_735476 [Mollisia scopiformis]
MAPTVRYILISALRGEPLMQIRPRDPASRALGFLQTDLSLLYRVIVQDGLVSGCDRHWRVILQDLHRTLLTISDMNNKVNLAFYTQLICFYRNHHETESVFLSPDNPQQRMLQSWAHQLGFAFEYTLATHSGRVVRMSPPEKSTNPENDNLNFLGLDNTTIMDPDHCWTFGHDMFSETSTRVNPVPSFAAVDYSIAQHQPLIIDYSAHTGTCIRSEDFAPKYNQVTESALADLPRSSGNLSSPLTKCCTHAFSLEHTVISALSTLDQEMTGFQNNCCSVTSDIVAGKPNDVRDVVKEYISSTRIQKKLENPLASVSQKAKTAVRTASALDSTYWVSHGFPSELFGPNTKYVTATQEEAGIDPLEPRSVSPESQIMPSDRLCYSGSVSYKEQNYRSSSIGSVSSTKMDRGQKRVRDVSSRRPSLLSTASGTFREYVFNSKSPCMESPASGTSGRRGPLDPASNAAAKAVKAVRACWRCKFLRKTCSLDDPCVACPKPHKNPKRLGWSSVACRRGTFAEEMLPFRLCSQQILGGSVPTDEQRKRSNDWLHSHIQSREENVGESRNLILAQHSGSEPVQTLYDLKQRRRLFSLFSWTLIPARSVPESAIAPLNECIDSIVQETLDVPCCRLIMSNDVDSQLADVVLLLRSAAQYQASIHTDRLIAQSLNCLRSGVEALAVDDQRLYSAYQHNSCSEPVCQFDWIKQLHLDLELYLAELSQVFFTKDNMRAKESWWLSTFYSFCIQGIVRRVLLKLQDSPGSEVAAKQYLHLAVRLFSASSGSYDPLIRDYAAPYLLEDEDASTVANFRTAQLAVQQLSWRSKCIKSSAEYLRQLFEDEGNGLEGRKVLKTASSNAKVQAVSTATSDVVESRQQCINSSDPITPNPGARLYRTLSLSSMESLD